MASPHEEAKVPDMCAALKRKLGDMPWKVIELTIISTSYIWRPVRGHCFETWFQRVMEGAGVKADYTGGDTMTDMVIHVGGRKIGLQLKTPTTNTVRHGKTIGYTLHKTHGREKVPFNLYLRADFPEFLIGQHPDGLVMRKNEELPSHPKYPDRLKSTVKLDWTEGLNNFWALDLPDTIRMPDFSWKNKHFPAIGKATKLSDYDIMDTLMRRENFRLLEQNLVGAVREWHFIQIAIKQNILLREAKTDKEIKFDFALTGGKTVQVKGRTRSISREHLPCVEVKGSHGRIPQRLYKKKAFNYLVVVLDPFTVPEECLPAGVNRSEFNCVVIPEWYLPIHPRSAQWGSEYYKDIFCFEFDEYTVNKLDLLRPCICDFRTGGLMRGLDA